MVNTTYAAHAWLHQPLTRFQGKQQGHAEAETSKKALLLLNPHANGGNAKHAQQ